MNARVSTQAPGKLILTGEYAVLDGAPAVSMAVNVSARARVSAIDDECHRFIIAEQQASHPFVIRDGAVRWVNASPGDRGRLIESLFAAKGITLPPSPPAMAIELDSQAFSIADGGHRAKLGLGSSAAVLVALAGAVHAFATGRDGDARTLAAWCLAAHRHFQGGAGSGADVMTALLGGVIGIRPNPSGLPDTMPLDWPLGLLVLPVWSGRSASTTGLVARLDAVRRARPDVVARHMQRLNLRAEQSLSAWRDGDAGAVVAAAGAYGEDLAAFDRDTALGIVTDEHRAVGEICAAHGAVYKTSGAGGGDFGLLLTLSDDIARRTRAALTDSGWTVMDLGLAGAGLLRLD